MTPQTLSQLEKQVELSRSKLAGTLATLRSPAAQLEVMDEAKSEVLQLKDVAIRNTKALVNRKLKDFEQNLKARAAANPAAFLVFAAGLAWQFIRRPPIATALIGAGAWGLLKGSPPIMTGYHPSKAYLEEARDRLKRQVSHVAITVLDEAASAGHNLAQHAVAFAGSASDRVILEADNASKSLFEVGSSLQASANNVAPSLRLDQQSRDTVLLSVAGLAIASALAIVINRSYTDDRRPM